VRIHQLCGGGVLNGYETASITIGVLSVVVAIIAVVATWFFGLQVHKLTKKSNEIAESALEIQRKQFEINIDNQKNSVEQGLRGSRNEDEIKNDLDEIIGSPLNDKTDLLELKKRRDKMEYKRKINEQNKKEFLRKQEKQRKH
jgi:hypothetical protein